MPWVEALSDPPQLRRCIRDLVALSTLPAIWHDYDARQIVDGVAAALVSMLDAEFVHACLEGRRGEPAIEITRTGPAFPAGSAALIGKAVGEWRQHRASETTTIPHPLGKGRLRIAFAPVGLGRDAVLVAASGRPDFPTEVQQLLLRIAANETTIALRRWHAEEDERRFAELVENSSDFIGFASLEGAPLYINAAGLQLVGLTRLEDVDGLHVLDFLMPQQKERASLQYWPRVMRDGRWIGELEYRHFQTGAAIPFLVEWFRIDHPRSGQPMNIATVSRDLRAQKRSEAELRQLNETLEQRVAERTAELANAHRKLVAEIGERERADARLDAVQSELFHAARLSAAGQMAAALAHEINQPLTAAANSIHAVRRLVADGAPNNLEIAREVMDEAAEQALRAGQIIRRLRDLVTRDETEMRFESIGTMVEEASALAVTGSGALAPSVRFRLSEDAVKVFANRIQIQQVLLNLIRNAMEAMAESNNREITLTTALLDVDTVEIVVADNGPGIASEIQERLFEPFVSTRRDGMGLGLSICRSIIEAHGGRIRGEARPGGGTVFRFTLPAARADGDDDDGG